MYILQKVRRKERKKKWNAIYNTYSTLPL